MCGIVYSTRPISKRSLRYRLRKFFGWLMPTFSASSDVDMAQPPLRTVNMFLCTASINVLLGLPTGRDWGHNWGRRTHDTSQLPIAKLKIPQESPPMIAHIAIQPEQPTTPQIHHTFTDLLPQKSELDTPPKTKELFLKFSLTFRCPTYNILRIKTPLSESKNLLSSNYMKLNKIRNIKYEL